MARLEHRYSLVRATRLCSSCCSDLTYFMLERAVGELENHNDMLNFFF